MIYIHTALACEAKPLIQHFRLKEAPPIGGFRIYQSDEVRLVVSGPHRVPAAASIALLASQTDQAYPVFLNVGVAGHNSASVGSAFIAHKVSDLQSGYSWYPQGASSLPCASDSLVCSEGVCRQYPEGGLVDMESAGFFPTALRFSCSELVQAFKVVSDNPEHPVEALDKRRVSALIQDHLSTLEGCLHHLHQLARPLRRESEDPPFFAELSSQYHFSATQTLQLRELLGRWDILCETPPREVLGDCHNGRQALQHLKTLLDQYKFL